MWVDASGRATKQKHDISVEALPSTVLSSIKSRYGGFAIDDAERVEQDGVVYYQVELEGKGERGRSMVFTANGNEEKTIPYWD